MARLDYIFVSQFARLEPGGILTAVGAGFVQLALTPALPTPLVVYIVARVEFDEDDRAPVPMTLTLKQPNQQGALTILGMVQAADSNAVVLDGKVQVLSIFALNLVLAEYGRYEVSVELEDQAARRLAFLVVAAAGA